MRTSLIVSATVLLIAAIGFLYFEPLPGDTTKEALITEGKAGVFRIGDNKTELLDRSSLAFHAFCATEWIQAPIKSEKQRKCLFAADEWTAEQIGDDGVCPQNSDSHTTLFFADDHLAKVSVRCTQSK